MNLQFWHHTLVLPWQHINGRQVPVVPVQPPTGGNPAIMTEDGKAIEDENGNAILEN